MIIKSHLTPAYRAKNDPYYHLTSVQGIETLTDYQVRLTRRLKNYDRLAIKACHGVGKTWWAARVVLWFLSSYSPSIIITTAPTGRMVKNLLWAEIRAGHRDSHAPLGGTILTTEWKMKPKWFAVGFSPQKEAASDVQHQEATSFQGYHQKNMLFVLDEATGIPKQIWDQLEGMTTGRFFKIVAIGNPTSKSSQFFQCFHGKKKSIWRNETIRCFDSPNLKLNDIWREIHIANILEKLDGISIDESEHYLKSFKQPNEFLVSARWVIERALEWGIDHPLFRSKVLAEFPEEDENAMFSLTQITEAINRETPDLEKIKRRSIGVDPARFGTDKTIISVMEDGVLNKKIALTKRRTTYVTGQVIDLHRSLNINNKAEHVVISVDATGIGAGVTDELEEAAQNDRINAQVEEVQFGGSPAYKYDSKSKQDADKEHYANFKAKIFRLLSKDLSENIIISLNETDSEIYQDQLPTINYKFDSKGRLIIESKKDYKTRTGRHSPDESDSFAIANWGNYVRLRTKDTGPRVTRL